MTKKGNRVANLGNKGVIETLVVKAQDLVQVVSKASGFLFRSVFVNNICTCV